MSVSENASQPKGRFVACQARTADEMASVRRLRAKAFGVEALLEPDIIDNHATHVLVYERASGALVSCFRMLALYGADLPQSYAAQFYDLTALQGYDGVLLELGRFCVHPDWHDPDILRTAWAALTAYVDSNDVKLLFGCSSFEGIEPQMYQDSFGVLKARHLAPARWMPGVGASNVYRFAEELNGCPDVKEAMAQMPPLLRTYLLMGGWVSSHAVVDHQMNTLHVFTGLEIGLIPERRKQVLRALV